METNIYADSSYTRCHDFEQKQTVFDSSQAIDMIYPPFRVLPLFESFYYERIQIKRNSLKSNDTLASRWRKYVHLCLSRVQKKTPHWIPKTGVDHFYNYYVHFKPPQQNNLVNRKKKLVYRNFQEPKKSGCDMRHRQIKSKQRQKSPSKKQKYVSTF